MGTSNSLNTFIHDIWEVMHFRSKEYKLIYSSTGNMWGSLFDITAQLKKLHITKRDLKNEI